MKKTPLSLSSPFRRVALWMPLLALVAMALNASPARAASDTWNGADPLWSDAANWAGGNVPGTGDTATFSAGGLTTVSGGGATVNNIVFDGTAPAFTVSGVLLDAGGAVTVNAGAGAQTLASIVLPGANTFTVTNNSANLLTIGAQMNTAGANLTFAGSGNITTSAGLASSGIASDVIYNGTGTLTLANTSNTNIQGAFILNSGTVVALNQNSLSNRQLTLSGGVLVDFRANNSGAQFGTSGTGITLNGDAGINYGGTSGQLRLGKTDGSGYLNGTAGNTLTFSGTNTGTNGIQVYLNNTGFDGTWKLGSNGHVALNHANSVGNTNFRVNMGDAADASAEHIFESGATLQDTTSQTTIAVSIGELTGTNTGAILRGRRNTGTQTTGTTYQVGALGTSTTYNGTITDGAAVNGTADAGTQNNGVAGNQATTELVKTGSGTLTLTGTNTHTGGTVVKGGTLAVSSDAALGATYDGSLRPFATIAGTGTYTGGGVLPTVTMTGGNPATAATVGLFSSDSTNNANSLYLSFGTATDSTQAGAGYTSVPTVVLTGGTQTTAGTDPVAEVRVTGLVTLDGGTLRTTAGITSNRAIVLGAGNGTIDTNGFDSSVSGVVNGTGSLTKMGDGLLALSGTNTYAGETNVNGGTLEVSAGGLTATSGVNVNGSTLSTTGSNLLNDAAPISLADGIWNTNGNDETVGALTVTGSGTLDLGSGDSVIAFADSSSATWASSLSILNWSGNVAGGGIDQVLFGTSAGGLTTTQLGDVSFVDPAGFAAGTYAARMLGTGEIVPVPEPAVFSLAGLALALGLRRRRQS